MISMHIWLVGMGKYRGKTYWVLSTAGWVVVVKQG